MNKQLLTSLIITGSVIISMIIFISAIATPLIAYAGPAAPNPANDLPFSTGDKEAQTTHSPCGEASRAVKTSINIGCQGRGNPVLDALFAILKFLSIGVGLVIVASMVVAGIQYSGSRGDPGATAKSIERVRNNIYALLLFIFAYAFLNFIVPGQILR